MVDSVTLSIIEYQSKRVLTTQQLAEAYQTEPNNIQMNFANNRERFLVGRDYHFLQGEELKDFKNYTNDIGLVGQRAPSLYLWTERGANRHSKILDTDKAWQQFDLLEETYFQIKNVPQLSQLEILAQSAQILLEQDKAIKQLTATQTKQAEELQGMRDVISLDTTSWREDTKKLLNKIAHKIGDITQVRELRAESYKLLDLRMGVSLQTRLTNKRRRMADNGVCKSARDKLNVIDVIAEDKKLIEGYTAIIKEMAVKYGC